MDIIPVTFTTYRVYGEPGGEVAHARRAGERFSMCGLYVQISYKYAESLIPTMTLCVSCEAELKDA
jgi:hypothetical protein